VFDADPSLSSLLKELSSRVLSRVNCMYAYNILQTVVFYVFSIIGPLFVLDFFVR
jgi:hypothetical protein